MAGPGVILLMAQIDDAPGELLGRVVSQMGDMGAKNVQLLSSLGKKGRPGHVLLVDILAAQESEFASLLAGELGIWGYRVLHSDHKHFEIVRRSVDLEIHAGEKSWRFKLRYKEIYNQGEFMRLKVEYDDLKEICAALADNQHIEYLSVLKARLETALASHEPEASLMVRMDAPATRGSDERNARKTGR